MSVQKLQNANQKNSRSRWVMGEGERVQLNP